MCLICNKCIALVKVYNIQRHLIDKHINFINFPDGKVQVYCIFESEPFYSGAVTHLPGENYSSLTKKEEKAIQTQKQKEYLLAIGDEGKC